MVKEQFNPNLSLNKNIFDSRIRELQINYILEISQKMKISNLIKHIAIHYLNLVEPNLKKDNPFLVPLGCLIVAGYIKSKI